jgi:site-specific DNA-methyltransferase (adenine-specific)
MKTVADLITILLTKTLTTVLVESKKNAPFIFQKTGFILTVCRLLPGLRDISEVSMKNANKGFAKITDFKRDFLNSKIKDGNADGKSDCTFRTASNIFTTTAKLRENDEVDIAKDMDALNTLRVSKPEFANAKSVVWVRDRSRWIDAHRRAHTKDMYPVDYTYVYDIAMFEEAILELRKVIACYDNSVEALAVKYLPYGRSTMKLKFHQHLAEIMYKSGDVFMFHMKCRSGKTVSAAYNIISQKYKTVLYITPVPSETKNPAIDTFLRYIEFDGYDVINLEAGVKINTPLTKSTVMVASKQYLDRHHNDQLFKELHFDAVYQDEFHHAGLTDRNGQIHRNVMRDDTSLIVLTGTGERVRIELGLDDTQIFYWGLEEEAACKRGDISYLNNAYGHEDVMKALVNTFGEADDYGPLLKNMYAEMPTLRQMIYKLKPFFLNEFASFMGKQEYSFDIQELFRMKDGELVYYDRVVKFLKSYLGSDDGSVHDSIMDQIRALGTRTGNCGQKYYQGGGGATQLWFLPEQVIGGSLNSLSKILKSIIDEHFPEYMAVVVNSSAKLDTREGMEKFVAEQERLASKKQGLIILLGKMMAMGVSLPRADIVCMFNNLHKIDLYIQMSMRCLTQDEGKSTGFVIDFNQKRVLEASMALVPRCEGTGSEIIKRMTKVIAFGPNSFEIKDVTDVISYFIKMWTTRAFDKVSVVGARLANYVGALTVTADEERELVKCSWDRSLVPERRERQELLDASEKIDDAESDASSGSDKKKEEAEKLDDIIPNFSYEVLTTIPPFVAVLTSDDKSEELIDVLLTKIQEDTLLNEVFRQQCGTWWKGTKNINFMNLLINIFKRCGVKAGRGISVIISAIKLEMASLVDDMQGTLEFLNAVHPPKQSEKDEFSEVFTPHWFADSKMLAAYPTSIWSDPDGKFYDPAAGSGVFGVCIYYRLMDGLRTLFPDETDRKKHILTKMLFMAELTSKNVWILKLLFGPHANIHQGDSLTFDADKHWGIDMKNVHVVGNPPYNYERTRSGATPLYDKFIQKYIDNCKTLLFVVPSRWFAGGKGLDKFRKMMLARSDIRFINHIEDETSVFGSNVSIEGGINYFMVDSEYRGHCNYNGTMTDLSTLCILVDSRFNNLINKVQSLPKLVSLYRGRRYGIETNDPRLTNDATLLPSFVSRKNGSIKYIDKVHIKKPYDTWKVVTPRANGSKKSFGNILIGSPQHVHSGSYISFDVSSEDEAISLRSYMKCKFPNFLLGLRKCSQDISEKTCSWIPLPPLDREWTDDSINKYYELSEEEIAMIH